MAKRKVNVAAAIRPLREIEHARRQLWNVVFDEKTQMPEVHRDFIRNLLYEIHKQGKEAIAITKQLATELRETLK